MNELTILPMAEKLEEIKRLGAYGIQIWFGEDYGCEEGERV